MDSLTFTLVTREIGTSAETALNRNDLRILGTTSLSGSADDILDALPQRPHILCVSHLDGAVYGLKGEMGSPFTQLGEIVTLLGYHSLDRSLRGAAGPSNEDCRIPIRIQYSEIVPATRCLQRGTSMRLADAVSLLRDQRPVMISRSGIVRMLIEALVVVSDTKAGQANGWSLGREPTTVQAILEDLIPQPKSEMARLERAFGA